MFTRIAAAVIAMLVATTAPLPAVSKDDKNPDDCGKYLAEMSKDLDTLELLVPNVPPEEASYIEKEYPAAIASGAGKRIYDVEHRPLRGRAHAREAAGNQRPWPADKVERWAIDRLIPYAILSSTEGGRVPVQFLFSNAVHGAEGPIDRPDPPAQK